MLELHSRTVEQVMVPLVDIVAVEKGTDIETLLQIASESEFSRIPVYEEQIYNIIGIVNLLDVIYANGQEHIIEHLFAQTLNLCQNQKASVCC